MVGARIARTLCPRFGMSAAETETVAWLIEQHLLMSPIAFSRDIGDPKTIRDFANIVQSPERLKLLLVLTVADIRAVGPGVWNGWKGQLLRGLYFETEPVVAGRAHPARLARPHRRGAGRLPRRRRRLAARRRSSASSTGTIPTTGSGPTRARSVEHAKLVPRRRASGREARQQLHDRRLHRHHRAVAVRAQPSAAAGAVCRRLRRLRRQHLRRAHLHHPRRLRARHLPARARVRARRGRAAPRPAHRRDHREAAQGRDQARRADGQAARAAGPDRRLHGGAGGAGRQRAVQPVHGGRGVGPRPAGPAVRAHQHALRPQPRHHLGAHHHLRREGRRRVLRHRPHQQEDHQPAAPEGHPGTPARRAGRGRRACGGRLRR